MPSQKYTDAELGNLVKISTNLMHLITLLGLRIHGNHYRQIRKDILRLGLDTSHFKKTVRGHLLSLESILNNEVSCSSRDLRVRLLKEGILKEVCSICDQEPFWAGYKLVLQLDHINGDSKDNSLENLRIICPNCHTQTQTFCGKNKKQKTKTQETHCECGKSKSSTSAYCRKCCGTHKEPLGGWPSSEVLLALYTEHHYNGSALAKTLGVSPKYLQRHFQTGPLKLAREALLKNPGIPIPKAPFLVKIQERVCSCGAPIPTKEAKHCPPCTQKKREKAEWPEDDILKELVWQKPLTTIGRELGVASNAVRMRCARRGFSYPPRGYWQKIKVGKAPAG